MELLSNLAHIYHLILLMVLSAILFTLYKTNSTVRDNLGKWTLYILGILPFIVTFFLSPALISQTDIYNNRTPPFEDILSNMLIFFLPLFVLFCLSLFWLYRGTSEKNIVRKISICVGLILFGQLYTSYTTLIAAIGANI